jgi:SAM-dependent methyltransferase
MNGATPSRAPTTYDEVPYATHANVRSHPDRLATIATLLGLTPAPVTRCRVLELGCGTGDNLIPMAASLPASTFIGCDLARDPIATGRAFASKLGLSNLTLIEGDLRALPESLGAFDYVIAHGVYSWVPADVRDGMLAVIADRLAPNGVGFVSYNVYPGCYERRMAWEMLRFHVDGITDPLQRIAEARALIRLIGDPANREQPNTAGLRYEFNELAKRSDGSLYHDDLSPVNDPVWFHEFVAHAQSHGLQYLGEAEFPMMADTDVAPSVRTALSGMDRLAREQYLDFARGRRFRQTLLCHGNLAPDRSLVPERLVGLHALAPKLTSEKGPIFPAPSAPRDDAAPAEPGDDQLADARGVLNDITAAWPQPIAVLKLAERFRAQWKEADGDARVPRRLAEILVGLYGAAVIELHANAPAIALEAAERPDIGALVRAQLAEGSRVTNLWHETMVVDDASARQLAALLDGTRDRADLLAALGPSFGAEDERTAAEVLEHYLRQFVRLGFLGSPGAS